MKSDIRRMAERLLDISLNQSQTGRLIGRNRDTVRRMRLRAQDAALTVEKLADLTDSELRKILMPSRTRKSGCLPPDLDAAARHIMRTGDSMLDYYEDHYLRQPLVNAHQRYMSYSRFVRLLSAMLKQRSPEYRHHYRPGEVMQIDFAGFQPVYTNARHERVKCTLLLVVFPFSQYCLGWIIPSQNRADTIHGLIRIFEALNGTTKRITLDNFKAAIDVARTRRREAKINPEFQAFLDHYGISPDPARAGEPPDKGSVEGIVKLGQRYYQRVLQDRQPRSIAELNDLLQLALDRLNRKVMRRWKMSRTERFEAREAAELRPLPETPYDYGTWKASIKVQRHYHVNVDGRDYSVPYRLIGEDVSIKTTAATVEIYHDSSLVAVHARRIVTPQDDAPVIDPAHMPENHRAMWRQNPDALIERATSYSPTLARFVSLHLEVNGNPRATHNMLGRLLEVGSVHGKAAIDAACVEAIRRNRVNADTLRQILDRGPRKPPRREPGPSQPPTDNIRGPGYYAEDDDDAA
ncbi:DDE-type integrase/transposase/recombinase [Paracoccus sp. PS-1]|uniref:Mu transposase domain-containing protein n=1 Tax=Paracoccus sp. PS1 TaxID=2963938 RepID=UPI0027E447F7|nr:DDE-type integrase/transposase/recombinase [Paracoccus sp. PS1]MDQ7263893.1 DDE-type integrase/transposase/recombinase [Paracoccus sp. PS1]